MAYELTFNGALAARAERNTRNRQAGAHLRQRTDLWTDIECYRAATTSAGCSELNLWELYRTLRWLQPAEVLECGSGLSTIAIAHALKKNADEGRPGRVTSLEDQEPFFEEHQRLCPEALRPFVAYHLRAKRDTSFYLFHGVAYADVPALPYEFVFVDGPDHHSVEGGQMSCNLDFIGVVSKSPIPVWGQIDGRITTVFVMQTVFAHSQVRFTPETGVTALGPVTRADLPAWDASSLFSDNTMRRPITGRYLPVWLR